MKKSLFLCLSALLLVVTGCKKEVESVTVMPESITITVNGVSFKMIKVDGGTFTMGATPEQGDDAFDSEMPAHSVTLSDYCIGQGDAGALAGGDGQQSELFQGEQTAGRGSLLERLPANSLRS